MNRKYGWRKSLPDFRDYSFDRISPRLAILPQVVYLITPPVQDQGQEGSCVFHAITSAMEYVEIDQHVSLTMLSRAFPYYNYRLSIDAIQDDPGADPRAALKIFANQGTCREDIWPYIQDNFAKEPTPEAYADAGNHKIITYYALNGLVDMLNCLASGFGFICGISVYDSFESDDAAKTGIIPMPSPNEHCLGGHMIYVGGGYDQHKKVFKFMNSWGTGWGDGGFGYLPFEYLSNPTLAGDWFTIRK
jgi:C1A family cysteine protease